MSDQTTQEPTMEEILASIRRIISEDEAPAETAQPAAEAAPAQPDPEPAAEAAPEPEPEPLAAEAAPEPAVEEEVLDLTERYEEPAPAPAAPTAFDTVGDIEATPRPDPFPAADPVPTSYDPEPSEALVSDRTADSAASAFAGLAASLTMPREGRSLEDVVKELMKPLLKDWLDQNLPAIVEAEVRAEVERIARRGAR